MNVDENGMIFAKNTLNEEENIGCLDDDEYPPIYIQQNVNNNIIQQNDNNNDNNNNNINNDDILSLKEICKIGTKILIDNDYSNELGITSYTIIEYDPLTTKATLEDERGIKKVTFLRGMKIFQSNDKPQPLSIDKPDEKTKTNSNNDIKEEKVNGILHDDDKTRIGKKIDISTINGKWTIIERTKKSKLQWISYKNTLLGSIAVGTKHLYPISLDYKTLMFISGLGLSFSWYDQSLLISDNNIINEHMSLFLGDSQINDVLNRISKHTQYTFDKTIISEILNNKNSMRRLMELEQLMVNNINNRICTITHDNIGHLGIITGYILKSTQSNTMYYFKLKQFGVYSPTSSNTKTNNNQNEYSVIDLYNQQFVITIKPPQKDKKYSIKHIFSPKLLYNIIDDVVNILNIQNKEIDNKIDDDNTNKIDNTDNTDNTDNLGFVNQFELFGDIALKEMINEMEKAKKKENVSNEFAKLTIFALIRLFDSRKAAIDFIDYIENLITNAFHSNSGSDLEWKFDKIYDISPELQIIKLSMEKETQQIRGLPLFDKYIASYNGTPLPLIEWEPFHRAQIKYSLELIIKQESIIRYNLNNVKNKLLKYLQK